VTVQGVRIIERLMKFQRLQVASLRALNKLICYLSEQFARPKILLMDISYYKFRFTLPPSMSVFASVGHKVKNYLWKRYPPRIIYAWFGKISTDMA
jgi:hypothetical protein